MALKPIPRLILIVACVSALGYGATKLLETKKILSNDAANTLPVVNVQPQTTSKPSLEPANALKASGSYQTIIEKGVVRVAVQSPAKPFYFVEKGSPQGFNYDFLKVLFAQSEFTKQHPKIVLDTDHAVDTYEEVPKSLLKSDTRGNPIVDIAIDGLTFTDDDLKGVVYSIPYVSDFGYSLITSGRFTAKDPLDIKGQTIGVLQGDPDVKAYTARQFPGNKIVELSDASINGERNWISRAMKSGQADVVVYDFPFAVAEIAGTDLQFAVAKLPASDIRYKIGVRKEDSQLLQSINIAITKVKETPEYLELLKKYFTSKNLAAVRAASNAETIYIVKQGDTLSNIASQLLGNKLRHNEIESRNNLPNPNLIQVGQKLVIPKA